MFGKRLAILGGTGIAFLRSTSFNALGIFLRRALMRNDIVSRRLRHTMQRLLLSPPSSTSIPTHLRWEREARFRSRSLVFFPTTPRDVCPPPSPGCYFCSPFALVIPTLKALGIPEQLNPLSGNNNGASWTPASIDPSTGARSYSASAYLWPNMGRPNLAIIANATVTGINLSSSGGQQVATGVKFAFNDNQGKVLTVSATKEVVLSAGSIQTPQLLELSGIGQSAVLNKFGIQTKINLPGVGENLQGTRTVSCA